MRRISLEELLESCPGSYQEQYKQILELLERGHIRPVKASGTNGKRPALHRAYWLVEEKKDFHEMEEELKYRLHPAISVDYYLSHPDSYEQDRVYVRMLDRYLRERKGQLSYPESVNERSFEIWHREKFLTRERGRNILGRCGLDMEFLNYYETAEPLPCYSHTREVPQKLLILENKDTFYSMRRHLLEGGGHILGESVGTLVYGGGERLLRSFRDFGICMEPYMTDPDNSILYFGDLDYEGIRIYENLADTFREQWSICPFVPAYEAMLSKAPETVELPDTSPGQSRKLSGSFFSFFTECQTSVMAEILTSGKYIPQEILNISDF